MQRIFAFKDAAFGNFRVAQHTESKLLNGVQRPVGCRYRKKSAAFKIKTVSVRILSAVGKRQIFFVRFCPFKAELFKCGKRFAVSHFNVFRASRDKEIEHIDMNISVIDIRRGKLYRFLRGAFAIRNAEQLKQRPCRKKILIIKMIYLIDRAGKSKAHKCFCTFVNGGEVCGVLVHVFVENAKLQNCVNTP